MTKPSSQSRPSVRQSLAVAAGLIGLAVVVTLLTPTYLDRALGQRILLAAIGAMVAFYGNTAAKALPPLAQLRCDPAVEQGLRRFTAWSLTLGGIGYALAWLVLPLGIANGVAMALLGVPMVVVVARWVRAWRGGALG